MVFASKIHESIYSVFSVAMEHSIQIKMAAAAPANPPIIKLWLRLEVFEHGILHFPSRYNACITYENVEKVMQALNQTETTDQIVNYGAWKEAAQDIFQWHEIEYKTYV